MKLLKSLSILILLIINIQYAKAENIIVGKNETCKTIGSALQKASHGDTVFVQPGTYKEFDLSITKRIYLKGINHPVIDGEKKGTIITIHADGAVMDGFRVINSGSSERTDIAGILIVDSYKVTVKNNIIENTQFAVYSQHSRDCIIRDNIIRSNATNEVLSGNGVHAWRSDSLLIIGNKISGHRDGIYFEFVTNSLVWRNISRENIRYGIHFMFSHNDTYISNVFEKNESGVAVMYTKKIRMYNNYFLDNWGGAAYGLLLKEISDGDISGNHFSHNTAAIEMEGCNRNNIYKNIFNNNGWAIRISASSMDNNIYQNNFMANTFDIATNGTLVLNKFDGNYWDKYEGYDLNRDGFGDIPYHPVSMYSMIIQSNPASLMLFRSIIVALLDKTEKLLPGITPENLKDDKPNIKPLPL